MEDDEGHMPPLEDVPDVAPPPSFHPPPVTQAANPPDPSIAAELAGKNVNNI